MRDPIRPIRKSDLTIRPRHAYGRIGCAVAIICRDGFPVGASAVYEVLESARQQINESFTRRGIPTPRGGWRLILLHPEERWQDRVSPSLVAQVADEMAGEASTTAVAVVLAMTHGSGR